MGNACVAVNKRKYRICIFIGTNMEVSQKTTALPFDPATLQAFTPKTTKSLYQRDACISMIIAALFTVAEVQN